ncbi:MAG: hypothetical protein HY907_18605 [Deltaproteobacteria bacterium]|nr:hypothetical protein [Deltaproteobacteria bacterium]
MMTARPRTRAAIVLGLLWLLAVGAACSEECTRSSQCGACQQCVRGSCSAIPGCGTDADGGADADDGAADADADVEPDTDGTTEDGIGPDGDADGDDDGSGADGDADDGGGDDGADVPVAVCPNGLCEEGESCETCTLDCGACPPRCGDGSCQPDYESCWDCAEDCPTCPPVCGNGECEAGETFEGCAADCAPPVDCGDGTCNPVTESCTSCWPDCGDCPSSCPNGLVEGTEECDDGNTVAGDGCEPGCTFTCHLGDPCDDTNPCTENFCDSSSHLCGARAGTDGVPCGTGDICTGFGTCLSGSCYSSTALDCNDDEPCTVDTCEVPEGCIHTERPEGSSCVDPFYCITGETCRRGLDLILRCRGDLGTSPCNDGNICTTDICDEDADSCSYETPIFREVECGGTTGGNTMGRPNEYRNLVCPDGTHTAGGADAIHQVTLASPGTLTVTFNAADTEPGATVYLLSDACLMSSCLARSTTSATATVAAGTYYIVVDTSAGGGPYDFNVSCP